MNRIAIDAALMLALAGGVWGVAVLIADAEDGATPPNQAQTAPTMTPVQAVDLIDRWRQVAILPQSNLADHVALQTAVQVLRDYVVTHETSAEPKPDPPPAEAAPEK